MRILVTTPAALGLSLALAVVAWGQAPNPGVRDGAAATGRGSTQTNARVETAAVEMTMPERYRAAIILEPVRRVFVLAPRDGVVRAMPGKVGEMVREGTEIVQLDRSEASARLKVAQAHVKLAEAALAAAGEAKGPPSAIAEAEARVEAARAEQEIAQIEVDRCTLRAPFAGRLLEYTYSPGQYVEKGTKLADLADVSSLRVLLPVDRTLVKDGATVEIYAENQPIRGKIESIIPLPDVHSVLRELATPWVAAWIVIPNNDGELEPGMRVGNPFLPYAPLAVLPDRAIHGDNSAQGEATVQVVRNETVTDLPVRVLGPVGEDRSQVAGLFRLGDVAIVESSIPMVAGTLIRFGNAAEVAEAGQGPPTFMADITPPVGGGATSRIAPIGSAGAATAPRTPPSRPATPPTRPSTPTPTARTPRPQPGSSPQPGGSPTPKPANRPAPARAGAVPF